MPARTRHTERRAQALSRERIVEAAVALLDAEDEGGLTFRRLAGELRTGPGALYHHVANKDELLAAATEFVLAPALPADVASGVQRADAVREVALAVFDAIDAHPWVGTQLARAPTQPAMLRLFELLGRQVQALGVPAAAEFTSASALLHYILGVAGQNAANARTATPGADRSALLGATASVWADLDPDAYPFLRNIAGQLPGHDDREQFLAGVDLVLSGIRLLGEGSGPRWAGSCPAER